MANVSFDANDLAVLETLLWWCKGFRSAFPPGLCNMPNTIALETLKQRMEKALEE